MQRMTRRSIALVIMPVLLAAGYGSAAGALEEPKKMSQTGRKGVIDDWPSRVVLPGSAEGTGTCGSDGAQPDAPDAAQWVAEPDASQRSR